MAFTCKDCLHPDDSWSRTKLREGMGISYGACECCSRVSACVHTPHSHQGPCPYHAQAPDLLKLAAVQLEAEAAAASIAAEAEEVIAEAEGSILAANREQRLRQALGAAANLLVGYADPNYSFFDDYPEAISLIEDDGHRADVQFFLVDGMQQGWQWCPKCNAERDARDARDLMVQTTRSVAELVCSSCQGKGIVQHDLLQLARVGKELG